jgi:hypothetical protein
VSWSPQSAVIPPSTARDAPMMEDALSEPMNTMASAIFFGSADSLVRKLCLEEICFVFLRLRKAVEHSRFYRTGPTMLTRMPVPASSMAADFVMPSTACLLPFSLSSWDKTRCCSPHPRQRRKLGFLVPPSDTTKGPIPLSPRGEFLLPPLRDWKISRTIRKLCMLFVT